MGGGNCLFGIEDKTIPLFRGNRSVVEVASENTNPTKLPDVGLLQAGTMDTETRCFDLLCFGKYEQNENLKLNIQPADKIPNLITKNANGDPVFAEPRPMCTIRSPKGHNVWVNVELQTISTKASNYMCLGIKKQGEDDYFDILYTGNMSRYVDIMESDIVELIPLVSSTPLSTKYTPVKPGDSSKVTSDDTYDFSSVYRVHVLPYKGQWIADQKCNLYGITNNYWLNYGRMGIGSVTDQNGIVHENQLLAINSSNSIAELAYSSDGMHWIKNGTVFKDGDTIVSNWSWEVAPTYGNGIWCAVGEYSGVRRSIDGGKNWSSTLKSMNEVHVLNFFDNMFIAIQGSRSIYISPDAEIWECIGIKISSDEIYIFISNDGKRIYGSKMGYIYHSKDGRGTWEQISDDLHQMNLNDEITDSMYGYTTSCWYGGCYANGYFYVIRGNGLIARSLDGVNWKRVFSFDRGNSIYCNITYYKNKLWAFATNGQKYTVGLFNPDGTIDSLEN